MVHRPFPCEVPPGRLHVIGTRYRLREEGAYQELYNPLRDQAITKVKHMASLLTGDNVQKGVIATACEETVSLSQGRLTEHRREKSWSGRRVASQASPCLPLTACWSTRALCVPEREPFRFSSAIPLPLGKGESLLLLVLSSRKNRPLLPEQCYLTPSSVLPGL